MKGDFSRDTFDPRKHYSGVLMQQGRVQLDSDWNEQQRIHQYRTTIAGADIIGESGAPVHDAGFQLTVQNGQNLLIGAGRYYVDGLLCENESAALYDTQPDLPNAPAIAGLLADARTTTALVYLDVWQRHLTALDDPLIRETALGGPDTTTRVKTVWQVRVLPVKAPTTGGISCGDSLSEWDSLILPGTGAMSARALPQQANQNPLLLPATAGYTRLENQLYRIEIHKAGVLGTTGAAATFKWSRDNGSVVSTIEAINGQDLTVHDLGPDDVLGFSAGQWVEIVDDGRDLSGQPGQLLQIETINTANRVVTLKTAPQPVDLARHPKIRRWDSAGELTVDLAAASGGWLPIEDGVEVKFEAGTYASGNYWLVPARTATGDVEWPFSSPRPPAGIAHHFCRLGVLNLAGNTLSVQDCRKLFSPLADVEPAVHITGVNWINDDVQGLDQLNRNGLQVSFDTEVDQLPPDSRSAVVTVSMEAPVIVAVAANNALTKAQGSLILRGDITYPEPNVLQWRPVQGGAELTQLVALLGTQQISRTTLRVTLKGSAIWQENGQERLYLDGQTLGQGGLRGDGTTPRIDLRFPSGGKQRTSDFESWFYLQIQIPPPNLIGLALGTSVVIAGASTTGTVVLDNPAPAGGVSVTLASTSPGIVNVPANIQVPPGQIRASFAVTTTAPPNTADILVTAAFNGVSQTATLRVQVVSVAVSPQEISLFIGGGQQFSVSVAGSSNTAVTWSVQEAGGGSVSTTGVYVAPTVTGNFHVVATSLADPSRKATALVHVIQKAKDKEKEKEKEKEVIRDKALIREKAVEKALEKAAEKIRETLPRLLPQSVEAQVFATEEGVETEEGSAFIRPDERPDVEK